MRDHSVFVGLDYHDREVRVHAMDQHGRRHMSRSCDNNWQEIARAVRDAGVGTTVHAAIEASTGSADLAQQLVESAGWSVQLAHARYVAKLRGSPDKSDYTDAKLLADLTRVGYLPRVWLPPSNVRQLRRLVNYRQQLVDRRRALKLRVGALLRDHRLHYAQARRWSRGWRAWLECVELPETDRWIADEHLAEIAYLDGRIKGSEEKLVAVTSGDKLIERLMNEPEVGLITACVLAAAIGRFDRFANGKQLARYCGLSPRNASSGARVADAGVIGESNKLLRATLVELAWRLMRRVPRWRKLAERLRAHGKARPAVAAAVANRWARGLYHRMLACEG